MTEKLRRATAKELPALWSFYEAVCAAQAESRYGPSWHMGIYPAIQDLEERTQAGELCYLPAGEGIAAAAVLAAGEDAMYSGVKWPSGCAAEEVCTLHLFAVHPAFRRSGISGQALEALLCRAKVSGFRVMRLDVVKGNLPAERLYLRHGFRFAEERVVFYEDTGEIGVRLYECVL